MRNYCGYSEDELWQLTLPQLSLDYYFALKARHKQAEALAIVLQMGSGEQEHN